MEYYIIIKIVFTTWENIHNNGYYILKCNKPMYFVFLQYMGHPEALVEMVFNSSQPDISICKWSQGFKDIMQWFPNISCR